MGLRFDRGNFVLRRTGAGGMVLDAALTRTGIFVYHTEKGTVRELRHPREVFKADSLATLRDLPVTDGHPAPGRVTPDNVRAFKRGHVSGEPRQDGDKIAAALVVDDGELMGAVERRDRSEVSCGYQCDVKDEPGEYEGQRYDREQVNIRYNHVAVVKRGRAGSEVRLRLDSEGNMLRMDADDDREDGPADVAKAKRQIMAMVARGTESIENIKRAVGPDAGDLIAELIQAGKLEKAGLYRVQRADAKEENEDTMKIRIDGTDYPITTDAECKAAQAALDRVLSAANSKAEKAEGRADAAEEKATKAEGALKEATDPKRLDALVEARSRLVSTAHVVLGSDVKLDGLSEAEIMRKVIAEKSPAAKLDGKSEDYLRARFDSISEEIAADPDGLSGLNRGSRLRGDRDDDGEDRTDADDDTADERPRGRSKLSPREKMRADNADRANRPLAISKQN